MKTTAKPMCLFRSFCEWIFHTLAHTCALTRVHVYYKHNIRTVFSTSFWRYGFCIFCSSLEKKKCRFDLHAKRLTLRTPTRCVLASANIWSEKVLLYFIYLHVRIYWGNNNRKWLRMLLNLFPAITMVFYFSTRRWRTKSFLFSPSFSV